MNKFNFVLLVVLIALSLFLIKQKRSNYNIVVDRNGFKPQNLNIKKGDSVTFSTALSVPFWPASNPHPSHSDHSEFDPKKAIKNGETWTFKFEKSGSFTFHDHLNPSLRGVVKVTETNPLIFAYSGLSNLWVRNFVKHDAKFLDKISASCGGSRWEERQGLEDCWNNFFSKLTSDFGVAESMRILGVLTKNGDLALSDCHNFADQIGSDAYWQYITGRKFGFTKDLGICSHGFFHGFMLEHVSHGQDFEGSLRLCDSLGDLQSEAVRQCYVGAGNGLTYYFLNIFGNDTKKIAEESFKKCNILTKGKDDCVYGVYGGFEHMFLGVHGSSLAIDKANPYSLCKLEKNQAYLEYCYERVTRPLFSDLIFDISKIAKWINTIPVKKIQKFEAKNIGNFISQFKVHDNETAVSELLNKCEVFQSLRADCSEGVFEGVFSNLKASDRLSSFNCDFSLFKSENRYICKSKYQETIESTNVE